MPYNVYGGRHMLEYNRDAVANTIKRLRIEKGKSQEVLSGFAGIARSHLSMIENGSKQANFETLWKIAFALDMKPSELICQIEQETLSLHIDKQKSHPL